MGRLVIQFTSGGKSIDNMNNQELIEDKNIGKMQDYQKKFNTDRMREIEIEGDNFIIDLNLDLLTWPPFIDWEKLEYPDENTRGKVLEIVYYASIHDKIKRELDKIYYSDFSNKYSIRNSSEEILKIVQKIESPKYITKLTLNIDFYVNNILHTLNQEVSYSVNYVKNNASIKIKNTAVNDAVNNINNNVDSLLISLLNFDAN